MDSAMHQRNLESNILFMQQEHASTLKALHDEIQKLQKRCSDLTFQLTMHGLSIGDEECVDKQTQDMQRELEASRSRISSLEREVSDRDKRLEKMEMEARVQRKRYLDESRAQSQATNALRAELEAKANNIAYLTTELHRLKVRQQRDGAAEPPTGSGQVGAGQGHGRLQVGSGTRGGIKTHTQFMPAPPPRDLSTLSASASARLRRPNPSKRAPSSSGVAGLTVTSASTVSTSHPASADVASRQGANPLRLSSGRSSGSESPDISPFLGPKEEPVVVVEMKQAPKVLPPIPASSVMDTRGVIVHQVISSTSQHRQKQGPPNASDAAIVTLAVETAAPDTAWGRAQGSHSSEYN